MWNAVLTSGAAIIEYREKKQQHCIPLAGVQHQSDGSAEECVCVCV